MYKLEIPQVKLPQIYVAESQAEVDQMQDAGLPYIMWSGGKDKLIKLVFLPYLKKKFPAILWNKLFNLDEDEQPRNIIINVPGRAVAEVENNHETFAAETTGNAGDEISDVATDERYFNRSYEAGAAYETPLDAFVGSDFEVDIEVLEELNLLPKFMSDIATNIMENLRDVQWRPGYNKKLGAPIGVCDGGEEMRNLLIIDVSCSIPRGIAATMLALAETLRNKCNADLIVTGKYSYYYPKGSQLPTPEELRKKIPPAQESVMFCRIIENDLANKSFANVIAFGDCDTPYMEYGAQQKLSTIKVMHVWNYHTGIASSWRRKKKDEKLKCGYAKWTSICCTPEQHFDTSWCKFIDNND